MKRKILPAVVLAALVALTAIATAEKVTIYRDTWGVPHIYGDTPEAATYGLGYAQAEDRLDDILLLYAATTGRISMLVGKAGLGTDQEALRARHLEVARERYGELREDSRRLIEHFVAGVQAYIAEHPERVPPGLPAPDRLNVVALYRAFVYGWPWGQALSDLKHAGSHVQDGRGSNEWVVSSSRSAEGAPIALIDPHLRWKRDERFYEAHVHGGDLHYYGFPVIGTHIMALGHTDVLSFACTTGGPDCADVYEERLHPDDPTRYEYDGKWLPVEVEDLKITVREGDSTFTVPSQVERTHHGPIVRRDGKTAYAVKTAYDNEIGLLDQWLRMIKSRNLSEFRAALRMNQSLPQNIMYADIHGDSYYVRAGRVPVRAEGYPTDRPLPGWTSATEWRGIHPLEDLVQIENPESGFMQNCNISPALMLPDSPMRKARYPAYIYNENEGKTNPRGRRALALLSADGSVTLEEALTIATDTFIDRSDRWQNALAQACSQFPPESPDLISAVGLISGWDGRTDVDSRGGALFRFWLRACRERNSGVPRSEIWAGRPLEPEAQQALLKALTKAAVQLVAHFGRIDVEWGATYRAQRGNRSWPVAGCRADGLQTLRAAYGSRPGPDGVSLVTGGSICTTVVLLKAGAVTSFSAVPYGASNHPNSPHYTDQGEALFATGSLKPTWYQKSELLENLESQITLTVQKR
jgi:acyl-homoserine-lactone acylase